MPDYSKFKESKYLHNKKSGAQVLIWRSCLYLNLHINVKSLIMNVQRQRSGFDSYHIHQYHLHINGLTEVGTSPPPPPITSAFQVLQESARR